MIWDTFTLKVSGLTLSWCNFTYNFPCLPASLPYGLNRASLHKQNYENRTPIYAAHRGDGTGLLDECRQPLKRERALASDAPVSSGFGKVPVLTGR